MAPTLQKGAMGLEHIGSRQATVISLKVTINVLEDVREIYGDVEGPDLDTVLLNTSVKLIN